MADRIVVLGTHPGHILKIVENPLPRPRDYRGAEFSKLVDQLHDIIMGHEIPDVPEPVLQPNELPPAESLPNVALDEIVNGILEYLDARGGKEDVFRISTETDKEFGDIIKVVKAAELLDFVDTPKRMVVLTADGQRFMKATSQERQIIWKEQLLKLRIFKQVNDMLAKHPRAKLDAELVHEIIIFNLPHENLERTFETFIHWTHFGNLFAYDEDTKKIFYPRKRAPRNPKPKGRFRRSHAGSNQRNISPRVIRPNRILRRFRFWCLMSGKSVIFNVVPNENDFQRSNPCEMKGLMDFLHPSRRFLFTWTGISTTFYKTTAFGPMESYFAIIFCETGLVITPFLPGDSLLFAVGALSRQGVVKCSAGLSHDDRCGPAFWATTPITGSAGFWAKTLSAN